VLAALLEVERDVDPGEADSQLLRARTVGVVADVVLALCSGGPVVLVVEDVHWADASTLEVIGELAARIGHYRILLVLSSRPGFAPPWEGETQTIELTRLSARDAGELIRRAAGDVPPNLAAMLVARTDGVPLFVEELARAASSIDPASPDARFSIPETLRDLFMARLDRLGTAKETAQLGALLGRQFSFKMLQDVASLPSQRLFEDIGQLVDLGIFVKRGADAYAFKHGLLQDAAYESILRRQRLRLHSQVVNALSRTATPPSPDTLAWHLQGAGRIDEAIEQYREAAKRAAARWALPETVGLYRQALQALATMPQSESRDAMELRLLTAMAQPLRAHRFYADPEVQEVFDRALALAERGDASHQFGALVNLWSVHCSGGDKLHTERVARALLSRAEVSAEPAELVLAHHAIGCTDFYRGEFESAVDHLGRAIALAETTGGRTDQHAMIARIVCAWALAHLGRCAEAEAEIASALELAEAGESPFEIVQALCHFNVIHQDLEIDPSKVLERADRIRRIALEHDMPTWVWFSQMHTGWARACSGDQGGVEELERAIRECYVADAATTGHTLLTLVQVLIELDRGDHARRHLDTAEAFFERNLAVFSRADVYRLRGVLAAREGQHERAAHQFRLARELARAQGSRLLELKAARDEWRELGADDGLRTRLEELCAAMTGAAPAVQQAAALLAGAPPRLRSVSEGGPSDRGLSRVR
jgi:tetratricopeptide (TPR) repeat protein